MVSGGFAKAPSLTQANVLSTIQMAKELAVKAVGQPFSLTGKSRTDGSRFRKLVCSALGLIPGRGSFKNTPARWTVRKGCPGIINQLAGTYLITQGRTKGRYNLQIWNRMGTSDRVLAVVDGWEIRDQEIRNILGFHDPNNNTISSIGIFTGPEIVKHLGNISATKTKKEQMILHGSLRDMVCASDPPILYKHQSASSTSPLNLNEHRKTLFGLGKRAFRNPPHPDLLYDTTVLAEIASQSFLNTTMGGVARKLDGQEIERVMIRSMGYEVGDTDPLEGDIPDIRHQLLEVKYQQSNVVDLGRYTPAFSELLPDLHGYTTQDLRYLIILANKAGLVEGIILLKGKDLASRNDLHFVSESSWKVQCSFPTTLFVENPGKVIYVENGKVVTI